MDDAIARWIAVVGRVTQFAHQRDDLSLEEKHSLILYALERAPAGNDNDVVRTFRKEYARRVIASGTAQQLSEEFNMRLAHLLPRWVILEIAQEEGEGKEEEEEPDSEDEDSEASN